jgi:aspartyl aminopeptidase
MASEDKLLHEIHRLKRRIGHLSSSPADSRLLSEIMEDIASALSEVHNEITALKASSKSVASS